MAHHPPHSRRRRSESTSGSTSSSTSSASASASRDYSRDLSVDPPIFSQRSQTWMDFLRDSGSHPSPSLQPDMHAPLPPLPAEAFPHASSSHLSLPARPPLQPRTPSQGSSDSRKRRLTAGEPPVRRPSGIRVHSGPSEGSHDNPAVLDSSFVAHPPQRPPIPPRYPSQGNMTGGNDHAPPQWQPDSDVTHCFVCGSQFTFFYRKHHCRKCGRVVCSACSPHRITIPRQYIVHPPNDSFDMLDLTGQDDDGPMSRYGPFGNPALGGGEEVRVCNPCVPDPNYSPPPHYGQPTPFPSFTPTPHSPHIPGPSVIHHPHTRGHRPSQSVNDGTQTVSHGHAPRPRDPFTDRRTSYHDSTRVADLWPPPRQSPPHHGIPQPPSYDSHPRSHPQPTQGSYSMHPQFDHGHFPGHNMPGFRRSFFSHGPPTAPVPAPPPPQPAPRRQVAEEDECPICGNELPPRGLNGDETARTQHVEDCIALHSSSPPPPPVANDQTSTSLPSQRTRGMSNVTGNGEGSSNRMSISARGMYPYIATEKDCVDEEGNEAECVICFEEFEAGDKMARLVCWCKFHEACIRQWWDKKGRGACPTHQLQF